MCIQFQFNWILTQHVLHSISNWSRIKLVKAEIDSEENNSWLMCVCAGMHPRADRESICLSWHRAEVDGIDLDLSRSFLPSLCSSSSSAFSLCLLARLPFTVTLCKSPLTEASVGGGILAFGDVRCTLPGQLKMSWLTTIPQCLNVGFFGRTFRLWILNRDGLLKKQKSCETAGLSNS